MGNYDLFLLPPDKYPLISHNFFQKIDFGLRAACDFTQEKHIVDTACCAR